MPSRYCSSSRRRRLSDSKTRAPAGRAGYSAHPMKTLTALAAIICTLTLPACADAAKDKPKTEAPLTEEQKSLYSLGVLMSQSISTFDLSAEEVAVVQKGIADGIAGKKSAEEA